MVVISVSLDGEDLERFDELVEHLDYESRSSAVRDALYHFTSEHRLDFEESGALVLTLLHDHERGRDDIHEITHEYGDLIRTSLHSDVERGCVDLLVAQGEGQALHGLVDELTGLEGVRVSVNPI